MNCLLSVVRSLLIFGACAIAIPALAGSLSPRLNALSNAYSKAPQATVKRLARSAATAYRISTPHVNAAGEVQVYIHYRRGRMPSRALFVGLGARGILRSRPLGVVQAWVPIANLGKAAAIPGVTRVGLPAYGVVPGGSHSAADVCKPVPSGLAINHEGIAGQNVGPVQGLGITGTGVKAGVMSNGVDCIASSQAANYLPNHVWIDSDLPGSGDEGTAMLEEVHAIASGATLGFCGFESNGSMTTVDFLQCYDDLAVWGADVISDDIYFPKVLVFNNDDGEKFVQGVSYFAATHPLISLVTLAANEGRDYFQHAYLADTDPNRISLHPSYTPGPGQAGGRHYRSAMNFGAAVGLGGDAAEPVKLYPDQTLKARLTWNDPASGPYDDLDLFLVAADGTVLASSTYDQTQGPSSMGSGESIQASNTTDVPQVGYLAVLCFSCAHPVLIKLSGFLNGGGSFKYNTQGGVFGKGGLASELTAAAAHWNGHGVSATHEKFSNTGPFTYGDWANGLQTRSKPDITGIDGVTVSGAGGFATPFYGTSAASPNVGAVIVLLRSAFPDAEPDAAGWKRVVMETANSDALVDYRYDAGGAGLVDAAAALAALDQSPVASDGTLVTGENKAASGTFEATSPESRPLTFAIVAQPAHGAVTLDDATAGTYTYTPADGYSGGDSFGFKASDGILDSNVATVSVTVNAAPPSDSGGGGFGWPVLAVLLSLALAVARARGERR